VRLRRTPARPRRKRPSSNRSLSAS
jgi:hypothetical protein